MTVRTREDRKTWRIECIFYSNWMKAENALKITRFIRVSKRTTLFSRKFKFKIISNYCNTAHNFEFSFFLQCQVKIKQNFVVLWYHQWKSSKLSIQSICSKMAENTSIDIYNSSAINIFYLYSFQYTKLWIYLKIVFKAYGTNIVEIDDR